MIRRFTFLFVFFVSYAFISSGQQWEDNLPQLKSNQPYSYYDYTRAFHQFWDSKGVRNGFYIDENGNNVKAPGWKQFRRWEFYSQFRVDPKSGAFPGTNRIDIIEEEKMLKSAAGLGNWTQVGPDNSSGGYHGLGRINTIGFRPGDANVLYAGSPSGGLWKSTNAGGNWTPLTDQNAALGVSDVVVFAGATTASDTVFIGLGDKDGGAVFNLNGGQSGDNNGLGILKSVNGGSTWSSTGLTFLAKEGKRISRLLVDPNDKKTMITSVLSYFSNQGEIHKTTDGGATWTKTASLRFIDMEYKPGSSTTLYGSTADGKIYRSLDGGAIWTEINIPFGTGRVEVAVTPHAPNSVWAVSVDYGTRGLNAIYKSVDGGNSWFYLFQANAPGKYLLGYVCNATDNVGQGEYDLYLAIDPTDSMKVYLGGVNQYRSTTGGLSWLLSSHWSGDTCNIVNPVTTVHADQHFCAVHPVSGHIWTGNDGGVYRSTDDGASWEWKGNGLVINQIYRIGVAQTVANHYLLGSQDNGTKRYVSGTWTDGIGGDGADNAIDPTDENTQYASSEGGTIYKTTDGWAGNPNGTNITSTIGQVGDWISPFVINPKKTSTLLLGYKQLYRSRDGGSTWNSLGVNTAGDYNTYIHAISYAPSDTNRIYIANNADGAIQLTKPKLRKTEDGGTNWTDITAGLPVDPSLITGIAVHHEHADTVWVSLGQYNEHGVYQSFDGGSTWTNISTGLPQIPVMGIVENRLAASGMELYAATDVGVYMKEGNSNWTIFSDQLPNVVISELEIYYDDGTTSNSKLVAGTYGRGLWASDLYTTTTPPVAEFDVDNRYPGVGDTIAFTDKSTNVPTSWNWSISPGTFSFVDGTSASSTNPKVKFSAEGVYDVTLTATNGAGNNAITKTGFIDVSNIPSGYCAANSTNGYAAIIKVQMDDILNVSGVAPTGGYEDFSSISTSLKKGANTALYVQISNTDVNIDLTAFIDWNRDADFEDAGEQVACGAFDSGDNKTFPIVVPAWASTGKTKMRIRTKVIGTDCGLACGTTANGEVEDYGLFVADSIATVAPVADFVAHNTIVNVNHVVQFTDLSGNVPNTWAWSFTGPGNAVYKSGTTSASANPAVAFDAAGTYTVTLAATNGIGNDSEIKTDYITVNAAVYCNAGSSNPGGGIGIANVQLGSINQNSSLASPFYTDYSQTALTDLSVLSSNTVHITVYNNQNANDVFAWIDFDGDGEFTTAGEQIGYLIDIGAAGSIVSFTFTVPGDAVLGTTRMRVRTAFNAQADLSSCGDTPYGEVEDYGINIVPGNAMWIGTTADWTVASNWSINAVPTEKVNVTIPTTPIGGNQPVINRSQTGDVLNLNVESGARVTIRSSDTKSGSLIVHGTSSGDIRYRRFVSGNKWHLIASPVVGQNLWSFATAARNAIAAKGTPLKYAITTYNETGDVFNGYPTSDPGGNLLSGVGYSILTTIDTSLYLDGTLLAADLSSISISRGNYGWNLLGNPYTSAIKATTSVDATNTLLNAGNVANLDPNYAGLYLWEPTSATTGQYVIINNASQLPTATFAQNYIQAGQGFFVKAKTTGGTFDITRAMQAHNVDAILKSGDAPWPTIQLSAEGNGKNSNTVLTFNNAMTTGLDVTYDAGMFKSDKEFALYSRLVDDNGVDFALQALPENYDNLVVPLGIDAPEGAEITFTAKTDFLPANASIWLEDRSKGIYTQLDESGAFYSTLLTKSAIGTGTFFLHTTYDATLAFNPTTGQTDYHIFTNYNERSIRIITQLDNPGVARLYDMAGRFHGILYLKQGSENKFLMNESPGVYLVHIVNGRRSFSEKVVWK